VRISTERVKLLCRERGTTLTGMLAAAGVSRNAFYSLARRDSIYPRSLRAVCARLGISPDKALTADEGEVESMKYLLASVDAIVSRDKRVDRDNVRHTLLLLREKPIDRLRRALVRAQKPYIR
jgi:transcriptional regulator with XRE-family HTH domain